MSNKYKRQIAVKLENGETVLGTVDVYDVIEAWNIPCPALQHLIKKVLQPGARGHKSFEQDLKDIEASIKRAIELNAARQLKEVK